MAEWWQPIYDYLQAPYKARQDAGQVVTPGPIDAGGVYDFFQAPYEARVAREAVAAASPYAAPALPRYDPVGDLAATGGWNQFDDQFNDPIGKPPGKVRVASTAVPSVPGPRGSVALNKDQSRLDPGTALAFAGQPTVPPGIAAINAAAPMAPFIPPLPRIRPQLPGDMQWSSTVPQLFAGGDPWAGKRIGPPPVVPGMTMGMRGGAPAVPQQRPGGLLGFLFGGAPQVPSAPQAPVAAPRLDPLQAAVLAAQAQGQTYDRSTDPSFNPNSGWGKGNSLAGF